MVVKFSRKAASKINISRKVSERMQKLHKTTLNKLWTNKLQRSVGPKLTVNYRKAINGYLEY